MTASNASTRGGLGFRAAALVLGALIACVGIFAFSTSQAKAAPEPFSMSLTNGKLNLGFAFTGADILPAPATLGGNPLPDLWDAKASVSGPGGTGTPPNNPASFKPVGCLSQVTFGLFGDPPAPAPNDGQGGRPLTPNPDFPCDANPPAATVQGSVDNGAVTIPASGLRFPIMILTSPIDGSPVPVTIAATGELTGTFDSATGALSFTGATGPEAGTIEAQVLTGLQTNPLGSYCRVPLTGLTLSTTSNQDYPGVLFDAGLSGAGALTGTYNITSGAISVGGANCAQVSTVAAGAGSLWVSQNIAEPPTCPENTTGVPPNCVPDPCPPGTVGPNEPDCVPAVARISKVAVSGPSKAKRGKSTKFTVRITNNGNIAATQVRLRVSGRGIRVNTPVGQIAAGTTRTVNLRVRFQRTGKVKGTFQVQSNNAGQRKVTRTVRVVK